MDYTRLKIDQNNVYGNALVEYDHNGKSVEHSKTWMRLSASNGNEQFVVLELEDE
ncbi:hypothetical protein N9Z27_00035 [Alphaproteobacteria bacterium]|nr:hypothetical protein [Alphaproteobacteria bacterium]